MSDYRLEPAGPHMLSTGFGTSTNLDLTLENTGGSEADWKLVFEDAGAEDLAGAFAGVEVDSAGILAAIPDRYLFSDGITGSSISDGGGDMYDGGNILKAGGTTLNYSDGVVASRAIGSGSVSYFTRKYDGLFVFVADFAGVDDFAVTGNLGADGSGQVSVDEFTVQKGGLSYRAFVHRVHNAGDPSINHLILVPSKPGLSRTFLTTTSDENDHVTGLGASSRIYYLLFAKASGAFYPTEIFEDLADSFLETVQGGPGWVFGNPISGSVPAGQSGPVKLTLDSTGFEPGSYATRFAVVPQTMDYEDIPSGTFRDLTLTIDAPAFTIPSGDVSVSTLTGIPPDPVNVTLVPSADGTVLSGLHVSSSESWVVPSIDVGSNNLSLTFDTSSLAAGTYRAVIEVWNGETRQSFGVSLLTAPLNVVQLLPDTHRPIIYGINRNGKNQGSVLVIDALTRQVIRNIAVGNEPTDLDLTENAAELLVMNTSDPSITRIDLETLTVTATYPLTEFSNRNDDFGGHVEDGPGTTIYYVDEQWGPRLRVYDTATRTVRQTFGAEDGSTSNMDNDYGYGDIIVSPDYSQLFGWRQYGDGAGVLGTHIVRFTVNADGHLGNFSKSGSERSSNFDREPFNTPALMAPDGDRLVIKDRIVDQDDLGHYPTVYQDEIFSMSPNGNIVASTSVIYSGHTAESLHTLPVTTGVQAILPDYSAMVYFNASTGSLGWLDLVATLGTAALGIEVYPADGGTVARPDRLQWFPTTGIYTYQVYLGTSRSDVEAATPASSSFLGEASGSRIDLTSPPTAGQTYFWRVVPIGTNGLPAGPGTTRSFFVANVTLSRSSISAETVAGVARHVESIQLQASSLQSWTVAADVPWISFENTGGSTPGELVIHMDATSLAAGYHDGTVTMTSGGVSFDIPVNLHVYAANFMIAEADLELPYIYAISQESNNSTQPSFLVRIHTSTDVIESAVPCGNSVTDFAIHYAENRIYLTNWKTGVLRAFDRSAFQQVQTYQFSPAGPIGYGEGGIWRVAAGKNGRVILEESDQWIDIRLINTANGTVIATNSTEYAGDGEADPTGRYYYHTEGLSSSDSMVRFDLNSDTFEPMTPKATGQGGSVLMIPDGSKVTSTSRVFDAGLGLLFTLPSEVRAATLHGDLLFTSTKAYNGNTGLELATLPTTANVMSVSGDQEKLYLFPANSKTFTTVDLSTIAVLPPRGVTPEIADGATVIGTDQSLAWTLEPFATSYRVYFGTSKDAVANATETSPEYLGSTLTNAWNGSLPALALDGNYFWRVDVVGFSDLQKGAVWSFDVAPIAMNPVKLDITLPVSAPVETRTLTLTGPAGLGWTASTPTPWLDLSASGGSTPGSLQVHINTAGLSAGNHQGSVRFTSGSDTWDFPLSLELLSLNYTLAEADLEAPYVYAISQAASGPDDRAYLVAIDTRTDAIARVVPVGRSVTDLAIHYQENRIYVSNWQTGRLIALDRDTFAEIRTYTYGAAGGYGTSSGDVYQVAAGSSGRIVIEQEDQWIDFFLIDTATGEKIASAYAREGGGTFDPTGRYYYHGENNSSGAELIKYDTGSDAFAELVSKRVESFSYYGARRVLTSGDGSLVFWNGGVFDPDLNVRLLLGDEVVASTYRGEVLFTDDGAFNGSNGERLATLPVATSVQGVSFDQGKLYLFKAGAFSVVDIGSIAQVFPRGLIPGIADGSTVIGTDQQLSWSQEAAAISYDIYFGNSEAAVAAATPASPEFLGNATGTAWTGSMPALALGGTYWWRVDIRGFSSTVAGDAWSFKIAPIDVAPRALDLAFPGSSPIPRQRLELTASSSLTWSASSSTPWITLVSPSGNTPGALEFELSSAGLAVGLHQGAITFGSGTDQFTVPVSLRILALNVTKLIAHPTRPVVYGINTAGADEGFSHLLEIDSASASILRSLPVGFSPTDADLDAATDRLYVTNWGYSQTRVIDLANWAELPPLNLGEDVYRLNVASGARLLVEEEDQWIKLDMWDATSGLKLATAPSSVREGDGETDSAGGFYYHCDNNISNAHITKYDISTDGFVKLAESAQFGYGSRNLILSRNGERLFWVSKVLDSDLSLLGQTPAEVYATNHDGVLAIGSEKVWWSDSGTEVAALPFASMVAVVSSNDSHLLRFNATTRTLHSTALGDITDLPGPVPRPGQVVATSPERISWSPVPGATSYQVFIAPDAAALAAMGSPTATVTNNWYDIPSPLAFGRYYAWRADAVTPGGTLSGNVQLFGIRFPEGPVVAGTGTSTSGISVAMSNSHLLVGTNGSARLYQYDPATGVSSPEQSFTLPEHYTYHYFGNAVAMDSSKASVAAYSYDTPVSNGGAAFVFRKGGFGYWESGGALTPPAPVSGEAFGRGLAASGNMMLVGTGGTYGTPGRVTAYITEPSTTEIQTFSASDSATNDGFGRTIAMEGNHALVSAAGRSQNYNPIYAFSRSTTTGLWQETQKIRPPGTTTDSYSGGPIALSGDAFATRYAFSRGTNGPAIVIFSKNGSGQWIDTATIYQSGIAGSSSYNFGGALALSGDLLFVGDTGASYGGKSGGAVFSFRRLGTQWIPGPVIVPGSGTYSGFGSALAVRDGWLLVAGGSSQPAWLFRVDNAANHTPAFRENLPTQVVAGRSFSTEILADDADGNSGLVFDLQQGPPWMSLANDSDGRAMLSGTPEGNSADVHTVQIRVRDAEGAEALHTYRLTLLSPSDLPHLTQEPAGDEVGEGQEVILRADVDGIGPFQWQWYRDGEPIPDAVGSRLTLAEISLADSGNYNVRVSNVVGETESELATISVHPANRFAGDWPTFGGSVRHAGYHPARLGRHTFVPAWTATVSPDHALNRAAVGEGKAFVTPHVYFGGSQNASAVDLETGASLWNHTIAESFSINPPTYHNGRIFIQRGKGINDPAGPQLLALSASDGVLAWAASFGAQWERYEAPAVTDDGIWINGGAYGGLYGFTPAGSQMFFRNMSQEDGWTPTISGGRLFTWVTGTFEEHNPIDGNTLWSVSINNQSYSNTGVPAISGDSALVISSTELVCIDLPTRSIRWRNSGSFIGTPAITGGRAYVIQGNSVASFLLADGTPGPAATVPTTITSGQPLLLMDRLAIASSSHTYLVDPATMSVVDTFSGGGLLSYSSGYLLAAGTDGTLRAWYANGAPEFTADLPIAIDAGDAAPDFQIDLSPYVEDVDPGETLNWEIASVSDPSIFRSIRIDPDSGVLSIVYNPWEAGPSLVTIAVTDGVGQRTEGAINFTLPPHPLPAIALDSEPTLSRLTGLYEQHITVTNVAAREIGGFDLLVSGLRTGVSLYNGSSAGEGSGTIAYHQPIEAGKSVSLILEYFASPRGTVPTPAIGATVAIPAAQSLAKFSEAAPAFEVNRCAKQSDGSLVIEFTAEPGKRYRVQYSEDAANWKTCPVSIRAGGTKVQWIDRGPPWTDSPPSSTPRRFYRVHRLDD